MAQHRSGHDTEVEEADLLEQQTPVDPWAVTDDAATGAAGAVDEGDVADRIEQLSVVPGDADDIYPHDVYPHDVYPHEPAGP